VDLRTSIGRIEFKNPVIVAAGTFGYGEEYASFFDLNRLGALVTKTITLKPRQGNPPPRLAETPAGLLNSIGLENPGVDIFLKKKMPFLRRLETSVIVSISGENEDEYLTLAKKLEQEEGIRALEVNVSCPNVRQGEILLGRDAEAVFSLTRKLKENTTFPFILKLPPSDNIVEVAQAIKEAGGDGVSLINTVPGMAIDVEKRRPKLGAVTGGLSGPAIKPIALKMVWDVYTNVDIPIIGMGGIMGFEDALEFFLAGASAIAVGTANFVEPAISVKIIEELEDYLQKENIKEFSHLVGSLNTGE